MIRTTQLQPKPVPIRQKAQEMKHSSQTEGIRVRSQQHLLQLQQRCGNHHVQRMQILEDGVSLQRQGRSKEKPITTPLPSTARRLKSGVAEFEAGGVSIQVLPDKFSSDKGMTGRAETEFKLRTGTINYKSKNNNVTSVSMPPSPKMEIQTTYGPGSNSSGKSGYGKGTTAEDIAAGKTSLGYHEGSHGLDFIQYIKDHPLPKFTGAPGMSVPDFKQAITGYKAALKKYSQDMDQYSTGKTDCVGKKAGFCTKAKP
jgi:hypothetical protein